MPKKKKHDRNKVNFNNPKVKTLIAYLQLGENRITKAEILQLANKDIYYQLLHSGFIKETEKHHLVGTKKLHAYIRKQDGTHFSSSASRAHAQKLRNTLSLLPPSVLERKAFKSSYDIEKQFHSSLKTQEYKETLHSLKQNTQTCLTKLQASYDNALLRCRSDYEKHNLRLSYLKQKEHYQNQLHYLSEQPYLIPDYQVCLTAEERKLFQQNLEAYLETLNEHSKAFQLCAESVDKLSSLPEGEITVNIETVTTHYGTREIFLHEQFETFSRTPLLFLM